LEVIQLLAPFSLVHLQTMDHRDLIELRRVLRSHEDMVQENKVSILSLITKFNKCEKHCMVQITGIMNTLLQVKQQLAILKTKCNFLKNLVENLNKDAHSMTSNQRIWENKDDNTMIQMIEAMDTGTSM
jgi:hypothetical protein